MVLEKVYRKSLTYNFSLAIVQSLMDLFGSTHNPVPKFQ